MTEPAIHAVNGSGESVQLTGEDGDEDLLLELLLDEEQLSDDVAAALLYQLLEHFGVDDLLPEWEIGVQEAGHPDEWNHKHVRAATEAEAHRRAREEAKDGEFRAPMVHNTYGPYAPDHSIAVTADDLWEQVPGSQEGR